MTDLIEAFRNASDNAKHKTGAITLVCLDDESLKHSEYGRVGGRTVVPHAREEGGIAGLPLGGDCRFGDGVLRRHLADDGHGGFKVESEQENFRPDKAAEQDLFSEETLAAAGMEAQPEPVIPADDPLALLRKQAQGNLQNLQSSMTAPPNGDSNAMMMTMMQTMLQMVSAQNTPTAPVAEETKLAEPEKEPGKDVRFSGDFGRITVRYADVIVKSEFIVLVSHQNQATSYEPPMATAQRPIQMEADGQQFVVMSLGLSFTHKGDILLLMPLVRNSEDANAE